MDGIFAGLTTYPHGENGIPSLNYTPYYDDGSFASLYGPSSEHASGANHLFGDGSVHFIDDGIDGVAYYVITSRANEDMKEEDLRTILRRQRRRP